MSADLSLDGAPSVRLGGERCMRVVDSPFCAFRPKRLADLSRYALSAAIVSCKEVNMHRRKEEISNDAVTVGSGSRA